MFTLRIDYNDETSNTEHSEKFASLVDAMTFLGNWCNDSSAQFAMTLDEYNPNDDFYSLPLIRKDRNGLWSLDQRPAFVAYIEKD